MVTLTEVPDEHFEGRVAEEDDGDFTDTGASPPRWLSIPPSHPLTNAPPPPPLLPDSEISNESNFDASSESLWDRIFALRMIVPASTRYWVSLRVRTTWNLARTVLVFGGRFVWMASATAMLFGIPYGLCYLEDQQMRALEQEQQQKVAGDELLTGGGEVSAVDQVAAALNGQAGGKADARPAL
jgi:import receptor subunit TOM22